MSTSVFNPLLLAELKQVKTTRLSSDRGYVNSKFSRDANAINSVRRNIFGTVDTSITKSFVERELELQRQQDSKFWGFDFANEIPISNKRFVWEAIPQKVTERPQKRPFEPEHDISHLYPKPIEDARDMELEEDNSVNVDLEKIAKVRAKGQSLITDFLKSTKSNSTRLQQLKKKKMNVTPSPNRTGKTRRPIRS